ncbi:MAG: hypothetical protein ACYCYM_12130 [Saccharofermentanales bacterium]
MQVITDVAADDGVTQELVLVLFDGGVVGCRKTDDAPVEYPAEEPACDDAVLAAPEPLPDNESTEPLLMALSLNLPQDASKIHRRSKTMISFVITVPFEEKHFSGINCKDPA